MPDRGKAVGNIVKWGVKYGPHVVVLAQQAKDPAVAAAKKALDRQKARRRAVEHAATVREGTVLKTFDPHVDTGEPVWVVFSGDEAIAAHPTTTTPWPSSSPRATWPLASGRTRCPRPAIGSGSSQASPPPAVVRRGGARHPRPGWRAPPPNASGAGQAAALDQPKADECER